MILTDDEIDALWADEPSVPQRVKRRELVRIAQTAVLRKLATVSGEPIGWIRKTKKSRPEDVTVIDIRKEEADEWKSQFIPGFARSEPMYSAEALAAARVQALEEFKADLADALCADCENGVKSLNVKALEKFRNDYPTLSALIVGKDV